MSTAPRRHHSRRSARPLAASSHSAHSDRRCSSAFTALCPCPSLASSAPSRCWRHCAPRVLCRPRFATADDGRACVRHTAQRRKRKRRETTKRNLRDTSRPRSPLPLSARSLAPRSFRVCSAAAASLIRAHSRRNGTSGGLSVQAQPSQLHQATEQFPQAIMESEQTAQHGHELLRACEPVISSMPASEPMAILSRTLIALLLSFACSDPPRPPTLKLSPLLRIVVRLLALAPPPSLLLLAVAALCPS